MGRSGRSRGSGKVTMRLVSKSKTRMRMDLCGDDQQGLEALCPGSWPRKATMRLADCGPDMGGSRGFSTQTKRSDPGTERQHLECDERGCKLLLPPSEAEQQALAERRNPSRSDGCLAWSIGQQQLRDCEAARATPTPRRSHADHGDRHPASSPGCSPSEASAPTTSASPTRPVVLEHLEYPVTTQAAEAELACSKARVAAAEESLRMERAARRREEAAHGAERERFERAAAELQKQLATLRAQCDTCVEELAAARREAAAASEELQHCRALLETERTVASTRVDEQRVRGPLLSSTCCRCGSPQSDVDDLDEAEDFIATPRTPVTESPAEPTSHGSLQPEPGDGSVPGGVPPPELPEAEGALVGCRPDEPPAGALTSAPSGASSARGAVRSSAEQVLLLHEIGYSVSMWVPCASRWRWASTCSSACLAMRDVMRVYHNDWSAARDMLGRFRARGTMSPFDVQHFGPEPGPLHMAREDMLALKQQVIRLGPPAIPWTSRWLLYMDLAVHLYDDMMLKHREAMLEAGDALDDMFSFLVTLSTVLHMARVRNDPDDPYYDSS